MATSTGTPAGEHPSLGEFLARRAPEILVDWEQRARRLEASEGLGHGALRDQLGTLLERAGELLRALDVRSEEGLPDLPELLLDGGGALAEAVNDLSLLRSAILSVWEREIGELAPLRELRALDTLVDRLVSRSVARFAQARERTLAALERLGAAALGAGELDLLLPALLRAVLESTPSCDSAAVLLEDGEGRLRLRAHLGFEGEGSAGLEVVGDEPLFEQVLAEKRPVLVRDALGSPLLAAPAIKSARLHALYCLPLLEGERGVGIALLGSRSAYDFGEDDRLLFRAMAERATALVVQARLAERQRRGEQEARALATDALARLDTVLSGAAVGLGFVDDSLRFTGVNAELARFVGKPASAHPGRLVSELLPGELGQRLARDFEHVLKSRHPLRNLHLSTPSPAAARERREWLVSLLPVETGEGESRGLALVVHDVTERTRVSGELRGALRERDRALDALDHGDALFVLDRDFRFVLVNRAHERITRVPREQTLGRSLWELFPASATPDSPSWRAYHRVMSERVEAQFREYYPPLGIWLEVRAHPAGEGGLAAFFCDATERRRVEQFQQRLIGIVGRDLRDPLGAISQSSKLLLQRGDALPAFALAGARRISSSADRMARMIGQLLDFTRARLAGGIALSLRPANLCEIARGVIAELAVLHPGQIELSCPAVGVRGDWDPERLAQVFSNLAANALEHGAEGTPVEIAVHNEPDGALIEITNQGPPIPSDARARLFDPFVRVGADHPGSGLGLGLYIVQQIVLAHGGRIEVVSTAGEGTTFRIHLPRTSRRAPG